MTKIKITYLAMIISFSFNLIGCNLLNFWDSQTPISINAIADIPKTKSIYIQGNVIRVIPLLGNSAYQIQDNTGKIWVITTESLPSIGQNILIKCKIKSQSLSVINQELEELYLVEIEKIENP